MIHSFGAHLVREVRETRGAFLASLLLASLVVLVAGLAVDEATLENAVWIDACGLGFGLLVALALGCEVGGRERHEGHFEWLLREPGGLAPIVAAKVVTLCVAVLAGLFAGRLVGALSAELRVDGIEATPAPALAAGLVAFALVVGAVWVATASTFLPRGLLAVPAGLMLLAAAAAPAALWLDLLPYHDFDAGVVRLALGLAAVGGVVAFAAGFARGARRVRAPWRRGVAAALGGLLALSPLWALAVPRLHRVASIDPRAADFQLHRGVLSPDGERALVVASRQLGFREYGPERQLEVHLASGAWRRADDGVEWIDDPRGHRPDPVALGLTERHYLVPAGLGHRARRWRNGTPNMEWLTADGALRLRQDDPALAVPLENGGYARPMRAWVRRGDWLLHYERHSGESAWRLVDPRTRELTPASLPPRFELRSARVLAVLDDDRLLVFTDGGLARHDPATGASEPLELPLAAGTVADTCRAIGSGGAWPAERPPLLLQLHVSTAERLSLGPRLVRFDGERLEAFDLPPGTGVDTLLGDAGDGELVVVGSDDALWRLRAAPAEPQKLFPR